MGEEKKKKIKCKKWLTERRLRVSYRNHSGIAQLQMGKKKAERKRGDFTGKKGEDGDRRKGPSSGSSGARKRLRFSFAFSCG